MRRLLAPFLIAIAVIGLFAFVAYDTFSGGLSAGLDDIDDSITDSELSTLEEFDGFDDAQVFDVLDDASLDPEPDGLAADIWNTWVQLAGADAVAATVTQYRVIESESSPLLAYVYNEANRQRFTLAVNLAAASDDVLLLSTLVHEWSHVVSLTTDQFELDTAFGDPTLCATIQLLEGCALPEAYLWQFYERFWAGYGKHPDIQNQAPAIAAEFYRANEGDFVSEYAATNLLEDFAESFTYFVRSDDLSDLPELGDGAIGRVQFFAEFPELVDLRDHMRAVAAERLDAG